MKNLTIIKKKKKKRERLHVKVQGFTFSFWTNSSDMGDNYWLEKKKKH